MITANHCSNITYATTPNQNTYEPLKLMESSYKAGLSNCSNGEISGRLNIKNNQVLINLNRNKIVVKCANGSTRNYERYIIKNIGTQKLWGQTLETNVACFYLKEENLPNNNKILYEYDSSYRLLKICTTNFNKNKIYSTINFQHLNNRLTLTSSDNKTLQYFLINRSNYSLQSQGHFPEKPNEAYEYTYDDDIKFSISQRNKPDGRDYHVEYYTRGTHVVNGNTIQIKDASDPKLMRVKSIKSKTGANGELIENYKFIYHHGQDPTSGYTEVYDVNNVKTIYRYSNLRLDAIEKYDESNVLKNKEIISWGKGQDGTKDVTFLLSKTFLDSKQNVIFYKEFIYDQKGNIIKECLYGNLSGENESVKFDAKLSFERNINNVKTNLENFSKYKTYTNDIRNLLLSEEDDNQVRIQYSYVGGTDLVKSKIIKNKNEIKIREFYEYNADLILVKEIIDDGQNDNAYDLTQVTQRLIKIITPKGENPFINLPEVIEEKYFDFEEKEEKLLKKTVLTYSNHGKVIKEDIYNSKNQYEYSIEKKYDDQGRVIEEINPEGHKTTYDLYDANYNLLKKKESLGKKTSFEYDFVNRLTKKEEIPISGKNHKTQISYDLKSNIISTSDYLGNSTNFEYDWFNNLIKTIKPCSNSGNVTISSTYDDMSRKTQTIDGNGNVTKTEYNSYNKPIAITYANGSAERFTYNLNGTLKKHIDQEGNSTTYEYDFLQRDIKKNVKSSDNKSKVTHEKKYISFNLLSQKDFEGNITTYTYDHAGRKVLEKINNEEIAFFYDDLSRLCTTVLMDDDKSLYNFEVKDYLDRVIEERKEDNSHNIFYKIGYRYDPQNNKISIIRNINNQIAVEKFEYDVFNRLIKHEDAGGIIDTTQYIEDNSHLQKKHIDPVGLQTIETFDSLGRISTQEKFIETTLLSKEEFTYDLSDNLMLQKSTVINQKDKSSKIIEIKREYDEMNKEKFLIEAFNSKDQKETKYTYTKKGQLSQIFRPNQIVLTYEYDFLGNNTRLFSSCHPEVKEIDYEFTYNNLGQMIEAKNNISGLKTTRDLDHKGRILKETLENNLTIKNIYDKKGNKIKLILPDQSSIEYEYDPYHLKKVIRKDSSGFELYRHEYLNYDLDGNILHQSLINRGPLQQYFDIIGRKTKLETRHFTQTIDLFNPDGSINQMTYKTAFSKDTSKYEYDFLKQLTKEEGLFTKDYSYDSHHNRLEKNNDFYEINDLNQVIKTAIDETTYDPNGNPQHKQISDGDIFYKYDALDRLVSIEKTNDYKLEFEYDALHRRTFKKYIKYVNYWFSSEWEEKSDDKYLYDNQNEIAALDRQNIFKEQSSRK
ncbi:MAG: tRNA nuclease WapA [Candidatus Anoxychlamydiales bacterium]|nr:tRNA nuclease WapA [Candidatus Anoxychlamydiales bacterium]